MVILRQKVRESRMAIDACAVWGDGDTSALSTSTPSSPARRNRGALELKFRLREDRKKVLRISAAKYRSIEDHESVLRRSVLIRNTLRRVQREAREEKLARHRAAALGGGATNVSPSYLSASRPRSPSPIEDDVQVSDVLSLCATHTPNGNITGLDEDYDEDDDHPQPAAKRPRLYGDDGDDKEDERSCLDRLEERLEEDVKMEAHQRNALEEHQRNSMEVDDAQEILRDLYETCTQDPLPTHLSPSSTTVSSVSSVSSVSTTTTTSTSNSYNSSILFQRTDTGSALPPYSPAITTASLTTGSTLGVNSSSSSSLSLNTTSYNTAVNHHLTTSTNTTNSGFDWSSRHHHHHHHQQYPCGHSSLLGNDLQSVVFHSLIASLES